MSVVVIEKVIRKAWCVVSWFQKQASSVRCR